MRERAVHFGLYPCPPIGLPTIWLEDEREREREREGIFWAK